MNRLPTIFLLLALLALPACQILGPEDPDVGGSAEPREKWESVSDGTYSFILMRGCFCAYGGTYWVQVVDGEVVYAHRTFDNDPVPADDLHVIESIDDIFNLIEEAEQEADELEVEYSDDGYPVRVSIDWIKPAVDDEMFLEVSEVVPGVQRID